MTKCYIPHLDYTVRLLDTSKAKGEARHFLKQVYGVTWKKDLSESVIYLPLPLKHGDWATLGHEIVHVLQNICQSKGIQFENETEHTAYLFQYIFNTFTGYEAYTIKK